LVIVVVIVIVVGQHYCDGYCGNYGSRGSIFLFMGYLTEETTEHITGVGDILFRPSKRAKYINITIKPNCEVDVAVPRRVPYIEAVRFVQGKSAWLTKHLSKMRKTAASEENKIPIADVEDLRYARRLLYERLRFLADKHGFQYNKFSMRNQKTLWGSCSVDNNISLNAKLIRLPNALIDYVIIHELVHTIVKSHAPLFWKTLDQYVGNAKQVDKQLRDYIFI
jgi:predicted metal-dependent hydrolase